MLAAMALAALLAAAPHASPYAPPPGAWERFQSDLNAAEGLATGRGVTIALLSTGADPTVPGLPGKVTNGPDYIFSPRIATTDMLGTLTAPRGSWPCAPNRTISSPATRASSPAPATPTPSRSTPPRSGTRSAAAPGSSWSTPTRTRPPAPRCCPP